MSLFADIGARARRYLTIGLLCAITHNVIMIGADYLGVHYIAATLISAAVLTPMGYSLHTRYTFHKPWTLTGLMRFTVGIAAAYPLSLGLMILFCSGLNWPVIVAAPLTTVLLVIYNYASAHWAILRRSRAA